MNRGHFPIPEHVQPLRQGGDAPSFRIVGIAESGIDGVQLANHIERVDAKLLPDFRAKLEVPGVAGRKIHCVVQVEQLLHPSQVINAQCAIRENAWIASVACAVSWNGEIAGAILGAQQCFPAFGYRLTSVEWVPANECASGNVRKAQVEKLVEDDLIPCWLAHAAIAFQVDDMGEAVQAGDLHAGDENGVVDGPFVFAGFA